MQKSQGEDNSAHQDLCLHAFSLCMTLKAYSANLLTRKYLHKFYMARKLRPCLDTKVSIAVENLHNFSSPVAVQYGISLSVTVE